MIFVKFEKKIQVIRRLLYNKKNILRLNNNSFTLISSNCVGSFIMKDLNIKYNTPTINLFFYPSDFIKFVENIEYYISIELQEVQNELFDYPIGCLDDINIHFMHYDTFSNAKQKWEERCKRINLDNIYIMMTDRDGCTIEDIRHFNMLKYERKIIFTSKYYKDIENSFYIKGFEDKGMVGNLFEFKNRFTVKKYYDDFDYIKWFNS